MYVVREDDQSEGFEDSKEYFPITYGRFGGLEIPYTGEVKLGVDGKKPENHEDWMDDTSWWWHWKKFHYISWDDYGKKHKRNGGKRIQFSLYVDTPGHEYYIDKQAEVLLLQSYGFRLIKYWDGHAENVNYLMELPEGYMFYLIDYYL